MFSNEEVSVQESLERLTGHLIASQEEDLSHLARELHDDICQRLAMLSLRIEKATKSWQSGLMSVGDQLEQIRQQCSDLTRDVQVLSHELHPSILDNLGLVTAVRSFCREFSQESGTNVDFTDRDVPDGLSRQVSLSLFRVVQEALHNAAKYSGVKQFEVNLKGKSGEIQLEISDQGVGFDAASVKNREGLGLVSMQERIHLINGTINIESKPNAGTRVRAHVPVGQQSNAMSASAD
jgi:signal transduction histidine kinase